MRGALTRPGAETLYDNQTEPAFAAIAARRRRGIAIILGAVALILIGVESYFLS